MMIEHLQTKTVVAGVLGMLFFGACSKAAPILTRNQIANDRKPISRPKSKDDFKFGEFMEINTFARMENMVDVRSYAKKTADLMGFDLKSDAANVNGFDEVADSTWFTNRNARFPMTIDDVNTGPTKTRMASDGPLYVWRSKGSGVTPGFFIKDKNDNRYILKFDPSDYCGLSSGADVVGSRLAYAAGYNVPENNIEYVDAARFAKDPKAKMKGKYNKWIPMSQAFFDETIADLPDCKKDGKYRVMASKFLSGKPIGPFSYRGRRGDDANDRIRHENRRELRGLTVLASWINHTDLRDYNTLDMFIKTDGEKGYVMHYLIDFGAVFGSSSTRNKDSYAGNEYFFDFGAISKSTVSLGLRNPEWEEKKSSNYASIGNFQSSHFKPGRWVPTSPNPALWNRNYRDGFWGAKLVASFSDEQIRAAVDAGEYPEAGASKEMSQILAERRDAVAKYWFSKVGPMDEFRISPTEDGIPILTYIDWRNRGSWQESGKVEYEWKIRGKDLGKNAQSEGRSEDRSIHLFDDAQSYEKWKDQIKTERARYLYVEIIPWIGRRRLAPATTAILYLDDSAGLVWVGTKRSRR